jgi:hypothetical protein
LMGNRLYRLLRSNNQAVLTLQVETAFLV